MKKLTAFSIIIFFFLQLSCTNAQESEIKYKKLQSDLANLIDSENPEEFAQGHGIVLKDGMVRVIMTVSDDFSLDAIAEKYGLKDSKERGSTVVTYITLENLEKICSEPSVKYIRLPVKFRAMGESTENKVEIGR